MTNYDVVWCGARGHYLLADRPSGRWVFADFGEGAVGRYSTKAERARHLRDRRRAERPDADRAVFGRPRQP